MYWVLFTHVLLKTKTNKTQEAKHRTAAQHKKTTKNISCNQKNRTELNQCQIHKHAYTHTHTHTLRRKNPPISKYSEVTELISAYRTESELQRTRERKQGADSKQTFQSCSSIAGVVLDEAELEKQGKDKNIRDRMYTCTCTTDTSNYSKQHMKTAQLHVVCTHTMQPTGFPGFGIHYRISWNLVVI